MLIIDDANTVKKSGQCVPMNELILEDKPTQIDKSPELLQMQR